MKSILSIEARKSRFRYRDLNHYLFIVLAICLSFPLNAQYDDFRQINIEEDNRKWNSISTVDIDGDNDLDILALGYHDSELRVHWFKNDGRENFENNTIKQIGGTGSTPGHIIGSDLDHDGDNDVILLAENLGLYWFENIDGNGTFSDTIKILKNSELNIHFHTADLYAVDIDNDEDIDILSQKGRKELALYYNNCAQNSNCWSGSEKPVFTEKKISDGNNISFGSIDVADIDMDGDLDILTLANDEKKPVWFESDLSNDSFTQHDLPLMTGFTDIMWARWGDMDNDNDMDVIAADWGAHKLIMYKNDGSENFTGIEILHDADSSKGILDVSIKDINGDDHLDIVTGNWSSPNNIYYNDGNPDPTFTRKTIDNMPKVKTYRIEVSDLDQDGTMDIIYANYAGTADYGIGWYNNGRQIHVATSGSDDTGNGSEASPYKTIQHAINMSQSADTVLVDPGTYTENINFRGKDIVLASKTLTTCNETLSICDKSYVASTIIDGSSPSDSDSASVVTFATSETSAAMLLGFTIQNGSGTLYSSSKAGGGIYLDRSNPRLRHLLVKNNNSSIDYGGGIFFGYDSDASLKYSTIYNNQANTWGGGIATWSHADVKLDSLLIKGNTSNQGGGYGNGSVTSGTVVKRMRVIGNTAVQYGGGMRVGGGNNNTSEFSNILVSNNTAGERAGGIYLPHSKNKAKFYDAIISNNSSDLGGGLYIDHSDPLFERAIIQGNNAEKGGGIFAARHHAGPKFINTIIHNNSATESGGAIHALNRPNIKFFHSTIFNNNCDCDGEVNTGITANKGVKFYFYNSIYWAGSNSEEIVFNEGASYQGRFEARNSIVKGLASITYTEGYDVIDYDNTSFDTDPYFSDSENYDLSLKNYSPAIGYASASVDLSPYIDETAVSVDYDSTSRPSGNNPDIGAYENSLNSPANAPPVIDAISDVTINEDSDETTVNLSGISDGDYHSTQTVTVTASSADANKINDPTVTYTSSEATGSIAFIPALNANGNITLTVSLADNGGTENGGINSKDASINVTITAVNDPPTVSKTAITSPENTTLVGDIEASDPEDDDISYSIVGGNDEEKFTLSSEGSLSFKEMPNFESPSDHDTNNDYEISVKTSDGSLDNTKDVTITVTDDDDGPAVANEIPEVKVDEDASDSELDISGVFIDEDGDNVTKTVSSISNSDIISASISGNILTLNFLENKHGSGTITIQAESNGKTAEESFGINIKSINDPPSIATSDIVTVPENQTDVTTITFSDPDGTTTGYSYSLSGGDDESKFSITTAGVLTFKEAKDMESPDDNNGDGDYMVTVQVEDDSSTTGSKTIAVRLTSVNEEPSGISLSSRVIDDNSPSGTVVGELSAVDVDAVDNHSFSLVSGDGSTDNSNFSITDNSLKAAITMDAETKKTHTIRIKVTDSGSFTHEESITIVVKGINDNIPIVKSDQSFTISEASAIGSSIGTVLATDADAGDTIQDWNIETGNDEGFFSIVASSGVIKTVKILNYETENNYTLGVTATDGVYTSDIATVSIGVSDVSEGIAVTRTSGLVTTEAAGQDTFSIFLDSAPLEKVMIPLQSSDLTEGTVSPDTLIFTPTNWDTAQKVTVTGEDDTDDVIDVDYIIRVKPAVSKDPNYDGLNPEDVTVTNKDDEKGGFQIKVPAEGLITSENGQADVFKISLQNEPTHTVTIPVSSDDTTEAVVAASEIVFTLLDWSTPQEITVTGVDDPVSDGNENFTIVLGSAVSEDPAYNGKDPTDIIGTNRDNDIKNILLYPEEGIFTSEEGTIAFFNVRLMAAPLSDVKIPFRITSKDTSEVSISPDTLIFSTDDWEGIKKVYVKGKKDEKADGDQMVEIISDSAISEDEAYNNFDLPNPKVHNLNIDGPGVTLSPICGLNVSEDGDNCDFKIELLPKNIRPPEANVSIGLSIDDPSEAKLDQDSVVFTLDNWDQPQFISVEGQNDSDDDGNQVFKVITSKTVSEDNLYNGIPSSDLIYNNIDNEGPGFVIKPVSGLKVSEDGTTAEATIQLRTRPSSPVTLLIATANDNEGKLSIGNYDGGKLSSIISVSFNASNWSESQTVTITGIDDDEADEEKGFAIVTFPAISEDPDYKNINPVDIIVFNEDNDTGNIRKSWERQPDPIVVTERGGKGTFTFKISSEPTHAIDFNVSSSDTTEGTVSPASGTIWPDKWDTPIIFTITGEDDNEADGDQTFEIKITPMRSEDPYYKGMETTPVPVKNKDYEADMFPLVSSYDFFRIETDTTSLEYIRIENSGNDTLSLSNIQITGDIFSLESNSMKIPPDTSGSSMDSILVRITPSDSTGKFSGILTFSHNDPDKDKLSTIEVIAHVITADYVGPEINISVVESIQENMQLEISANISDVNEVITDDVILFYRDGWDGIYNNTVMTKDTSETSTHYTAEIPGENITWRGMNFYIRAEDGRGNVKNSDTLSVQISFGAGKLSTNIKDSFFDTGFPEDSWRMISIPADLNENRVEQVFQDALGKLEIKNWTIWSYNGGKKNRGFIEPALLSPGQSYWLIQHVNSAAEFELGAGSSKDQSGFLFNLDPGWNMIGNPYPFKTTFELNDTLFSGPHTYGKGGIEGWSIENDLEPWGGYAVFNRTDFSTTVKLKPVENSPSLYRNIVLPPDGWQLNLSAYGETYADPNNAIGRISGSLEEYDFRDNPEPPYVDGYVSVIMPRDGWKNNISQFSSDIRSLDEENGVWDIELRVRDEDGPVSMSFSMEGVFPVENHIVLLNMLTRDIISIEETPSIIFEQNWNKLPFYPFKIIAGTPEYVSFTTQEILSQLPEKFSLHQNYPNPFNPTTTIKFDLPEPSQISLKIYNLMGQEVRTLTNEWLPTGSHRLLWNGTDQRGIPVSTGVYIYRLESHYFNQSKKMVLLK